MRFQSVGRTATGIEVLDDVVAGLSYRRQQRYVLSVPDARTPETRRRRVAKAITELRAL
jgi:hypothetical protein